MTLLTTLEISKPTAHILIITLNRPKVMNAINSEMMHDLYETWRNFYTPPTDIHCIILTGSGQKAFCAGADLKERQKIDLTTWRQHHSMLQRAMLAMAECSVPIIAAVNGVAFGGGLELLLAADFAYAVNTATFAQSETKLGIMPGAMGTQHLPRACGFRRAKELAYTGNTFSAQEAYTWGIINKICEQQTLMSDVLSVAQQITENAPFAVRQTKKAIDMARHLDLKSGYFYEVEAYNRLLTTQDREEGIAAFNQKRKPVFCGE